MAKHMTLDTRKGIAHGLGCGLMLAIHGEKTFAHPLRPLFAQGLQK